MREAWQNYYKVKELRPQTHWNGHFLGQEEQGQTEGRGGRTPGAFLAFLALGTVLVLCMCYLISLLQLLSEVGSMPILHITELRIREVKLPAQGHRATKSHNRIQTKDGNNSRAHVLA